MNLNLNEPTLLSLSRFYDQRGFLEPLYESKINSEICIKRSSSKEGVIRGLHWQKPPNSQQKLVYVLKGAIMDACLKVEGDNISRSDKHEFIIREEDEKCLFIPSNFAHAYQSISEEAIILYICFGGYSSDSEVSLNPLAYGINWLERDLIISKKDLGGN